jgi:hypothetical protein
MKLLNISLMVAMLFGVACTREDSALFANIAAVINHQKDPRSHALEFRKNYASVCTAMRGQERPPTHCAQSLAWLYNDWGAFEDAWLFLTLEKLENFDSSGSDIARRLILLCENFATDANDSPAIAAEKRWVDALMKKAQTGAVTVQDIRQLCRPDTIGLLAAYVVANKENLTPATAATVLEGLQSTLFLICEVSNWDEFVGRIDSIPEDLMVDCAVILSVIENASLQEVMPMVTRNGSQIRLSSTIMEDVLKNAETTEPMITAYHQGLAKIAAPNRGR